jgi:DNA-binding MurR/RpiR family transcriptional regulator
VTTTNTASELTSALLVTHALALHLARHDRDRTLDRLAEIDRLRARVVGGPLDAL